MSVFTFSTRKSRPSEERVVVEIKEHCERHKLNFSRVVIEALQNWRAENESRFTKVSNRSSD